MNDSTVECADRTERRRVLNFKFSVFRGVVRIALAFLFSGAMGVSGAEVVPLRVATFDVDATPPLGYMMAYDPVVRLDAMTLRCRGVVLLSQAEPIVLCAVDWIGIANEAHDAFRERLAKAAGTTPDRVAVHTLHQHDAPLVDFTAERLLKEAKAKHLGPLDGDFCRETLAKIAVAVKASLALAKSSSAMATTTGRRPNEKLGQGLHVQKQCRALTAAPRGQQPSSPLAATIVGQGRGRLSSHHSTHIVARPPC